MDHKPNKVVAVVIFTMVMMLAFAAFDDITTGTESSFFGEYWVIGMSVVVLGGVLVWVKQTEIAPTKPKPTVKPKTKKAARNKK